MALGLPRQTSQLHPTPRAGLRGLGRLFTQGRVRRSSPSDPLNAFDLAFTQWLTSWTPEGTAAKIVIEHLSGNDTIKGMLGVLALWWFWHRPHPELTKRRELVVATAAAALVAAAASRTLAHLLPPRPRPFQVEGLHLPVPLDTLWDVKGSSLPSDTAALGLAIVAGVFIIHRRAGLALAAYTVLFMVIPRAYVGIHWASDLAAGTALGILVTWTLTRPATRELLARWPIHLHRTAPHLFYLGAFVVGHGLLTRFDDLRQVLYWLRLAAR